MDHPWIHLKYFRSTVWSTVPTPTSTLCGLPTIFPIPSRSTVSGEPGIYLGRKVVPSACMEALMRHYKAAGFSDEVSRLEEAPRRPSTNHMYDDRWLRFTHWAARKKYDPLNPSAAQIEFGTSNCSVKALRYCDRYQSEHPELRKGRRHLFIPIKDNNAGKELSAATISRWICTTIVDSHTACKDSKNISVKVHEVRAVATSLQLFNKVVSAS